MKKDFQLKTLIKRVFAVVCLVIISHSIQAQVSGTVFRDFNSNGKIDTTASYKETGQVGVIVKAFNPSGAEVGTATTDKNGFYSIAGISGLLRIEFSNIPNADFSSFSGGTSVQFVNGGANNVNFGINYPSDFCEKDPNISTVCYVAGDPLATGYPLNGGPNDAVVTTKYDLTSTVNHDIKYSAIGSTWGLSYNRATKKMFTSAFVKRHTGLGPLGAGGIYVIDYSAGNPSTTTPVLTNLIDLASAGINVGSIPSNYDRGLRGSSNVASMDSAAWYGVGKIGLGDIDISDDFNSIFTVNLANKKIIKIDISKYNKIGTNPTASDVSTLPDFPNANCLNGQSRPFGLKYYHGKLYLGVICDASSGGTITDLKAMVFAYDFASATWSNPVPAFTLDFRRGPVHRSSCEYWIPWTDDVTKVVTSQGPTFNGRCFPQPILSDIEFDVDGSMILGFADRGAHMMGGDQPLIDNKNLLINAINGGDILRVYNNNGTYVLENNGTTLGGGGAGVNNEGPGTGEYYRDNFPSHANTSLGGLALLPGSGEVITTTIDPNRFESAGFRVNNNATGQVNRAFELYYTPAARGTFNKGAGLGDVEILCSVPPIQIGNRIWFDKDRDGIQDAGEVALPNIKVALYDSTGTKVSEVITNASGEYYFDTLNIAGGKLLPLSRYEIRIAKTSVNDSLHLTTSNTGTNDLIDSDGLKIGGNYVISVTTGNYGENNHSYDIGFLSCIQLNAGSDQTFCKPSDGQYKLSDAPSGQSWTKLSGTSTINASTGAISGLTSGIHEYILKYNDTPECADTVKITVNAVPSSDIIFSDPECINGKISIDAQFVITNIQNVEKVDYTSGSTFTGTKSYGSLPNIFPANTIITLPNPTVTKNYTIRLYNQGGTCFTDKIVELRHIECPLVCPPNVCLPLDSNKN
jgi:SdrD B-like domain